MKVLFVCVANVGRSQMAEAFFNNLSKKNKATSAGTKGEKYEGRELKEFAQPVLACMTDTGIDISKKTPRKLTKQMVDDADKIVVMADKGTWPNFLKDSKKVEVWDVDDAQGKSHEFHLKTRDQIKKLVQGLVKRIG